MFGVANYIKRRYRLFYKRNSIDISETSKCRKRLAGYCTGNGVDLGFGGDPINATAIRVDYPQPYTNVGNYPVQLSGDAAVLNWFADGVLDYIYSSHLLEDFANTKQVLEEWLRVLKDGGLLVLFCPDEQVFRSHCNRSGQPYNPAHKHSDFSLEKVKEYLREIGNTKVVYESYPENIYSWDLVVEKIKLKEPIYTGNS